jgi:copper(I)-binding protein
MPDGTGSRPRRLPRRGVAPAGLVVTALALAACGGQGASPANPIKVTSAYIMQTTGVKTVDAYFVLANDGTADRLTGVTSSAGGKVIMLGPVSPNISETQTLTELTFPGHAITKLDPTGMRLEIVGSGPLRQGTDITLTLHFARAGSLKIPAQVNNPATANDGYFGP